MSSHPYEDRPGLERMSHQPAPRNASADFLRDLKSRAAIGQTIRSLSLPKAYPEDHLPPPVTDDISVREDRGGRLLYSEAIFDREKRSSTFVCTNYSR